MKTKAIAVAMLAAVLALSVVLVYAPGSDAEGEEGTDGYVAAIGETKYTDLLEAIDAASTGSTVKLLSDVNVTEKVIIVEKTLILDLNGNVLSGSLSGVKDSNPVIDLDNATMTIVDTSSDKTGKITSDEYGVSASNNGKIIIDSIIIESNYACVTGNNTTGNMNFDIIGSTLTSALSESIYMPGQGICNITDGSVLNGGISARMGQINIDDSTIKGLGEDQTADKFDDYYNQSGSIWLGDAIFVWGGVYTSSDETYGNSAKVTITGNSVIDGNAHNAIAVYNLATKYDQSIEFDIADDVQVNGGIVINNTHKSDTPKTVTIDLDTVAKIVGEGFEYHYLTIADAVADSSTGTIVLLSNVSCVAGIMEATVDPNGFTITHGTYDEGEVTTAPTYITKGVLTRSCEVCGHEITSDVDTITIAQLVAAFGAIEGYEPTGTASVSEGGVLITYAGSYTGTDVMNDLARFLGVMYNTGNLEALTYNEIDYAWSDSIGLLGSNWANGKTTLVSVLVEDFRLGKISDSVTLQLSNEVSFTIGFDAKFVAVVGDITTKGTVTYSQFGDAVAVGGEITLLADVNETATINVAKDVAIHLNGKALNAKFSVVPTEGVSPTIAIDGDLTKAAIDVTGTAASEITFGTLKLTIPATKTFASDGKKISVSEASIEGTVPQGFDLIASSKLTIPAGKSIEGAVWFDDLKDNGLALSKVTAGTKGVTMTKGSVEIVGDFTSTEDGTITVTGIARIVGDSDLEGVDIVVPRGASLTVEEGITLSGDGTVDNSGTVKVLGNVEAALNNKEGSTVQVALTGSIDMDRVQGKDVVAFDSIVIRDIGAKYYRVGDKVDIPVTVNPTTATLAIDYSVSPSWLSIRDGHIVGVVVQDGSFNVTVKASMEDRETVSESFVLNAVPGTNPDAQEPAHEYTVKEIVKFAVIILVGLVTICLIGRVFIG